jgi:hypothetical protein
MGVNWAGLPPVIVGCACSRGKRQRGYTEDRDDSADESRKLRNASRHHGRDQART